MYCIKKITHPEIFQGKNKKNRYFEGWYYKIVDAKSKNVYAIIPGISIGKWDTHAFIQVLDMNNEVSYFEYDISDFKYNTNKYEIMIGDNYFSKSRIRLNLSGNDISIQGDLYFCNILEYPRTFWNPGAMGIFLYKPFMECYHDIINIQHEIAGHLKINGKRVEFSNGIGYIEKDWGRSMPKSWVWFQSNHFGPDDVSLSVNIGNVPWLFGSFIGFIAMFRYRDRIFMFTSCNGSWISELYNNKNKLRGTIKSCRFRLDFIVTYAEGGVIKAPVNGQMSRSIMESTHSIVKVRFSDHTGRVLYEGIGANGGVEIVE
jgi:hypothetical protein